MQSLDSMLIAIARAKSFGLQVKTVIAADRPCSATSSVLASLSVNDLEIVQFDVGDLPTVRNLCAENSKDSYIAWLDGDDLWGANWLVEACAVLKNNKTASVIHPEFSLYFGSSVNRVLVHPDMNASYQFLDTLYFRNIWTSLCIARSDLYREIPYVRNDIANGFGYEDWCWNFETVKQGAIHRVARGTVHAIREKADSLSIRTLQHNAIPKLLEIYSSIDGVYDRPCESVRNSRPYRDDVTIDTVRDIVTGNLSNSDEIQTLSAIDDNIALERKILSPIVDFRLLRHDFGGKYNAVVCVGEGVDCEGVAALWRDCELPPNSNVLLILSGQRDFSGPVGINADIVFLGSYVRHSHRAAWSDVLHVIVGEIAPQRVINFGDDICAEMFRRFGKQLRGVCRLSSYLYGQSRQTNADVRYLNRIRSALDISCEIVCNTQERSDDVALAAAVEWNRYPSPNGWMETDLKLTVNSHCSYSFEVFLPKSDVSAQKKLAVENTRTREIRNVVVDRGKRTVVSVLLSPLSAVACFSVRCEPEPTDERNKNSNLGFVLTVENIQLY